MNLKNNGYTHTLTHTHTHTHNRITAVHLKLTHQCKSAILQFKAKIKSVKT